MNITHTHNHKLKIFTALLLLSNSLYCQVEQNQKLYWDYRERLKTTFMKVGSDYGESLPMEWFDLDGDCRFIPGTNTPINKGVIHWADATAYLGDYIGVLATEYKLLKNEGQDVQPTLIELYYALEAINRLDDQAEYYLSSGMQPPPNRNGFFMRDDVRPIFKSNWNDRYVYTGDRRDVVSAVSSSYGKEIETSPCLDYSGGLFNPANEVSQDQLIYLLMGVALVKELVDNVYVKPAPADAGFYIVDEAKNIITRLTNYVFSEQDYVIPFNTATVTIPLTLIGLPFIAPLALTYNPSNPDNIGFLSMPLSITFLIPTLTDDDLDFYDATYCITNPVVGDLVQSGGGLMTPFAYPLSKSVEFITGRTAFPDVKADVHLENTTVSVSMPPGAYPKTWWESLRDNTPDFHTYILDCGLLGDLEIDMDAVFDSDYNKHMTLLMAAMSNTWTNSQIRNHAAPHNMLIPELLHAVLHNQPADNNNPNFFKTFLDNAPCEGPSEFAGNDWNHPNRWSAPNTIRQGYYNGLDYMLFYNLYRLVFETDYPSYFSPYNNNMSCPCTFSTVVEGATETFGPTQLIVNNNTNNVLLNQITIWPKTLNGTQNEYAEIGLSALEYLSEDMSVKNSGKMTVMTELVVCNNKTLEIQNSYGLIVGDGNMPGCILRVRNGSTLKLKSGSKIIVNDKSKIIIEPGGHFIYEPGAYIVLQGENALLDVQDENTNITLNPGQIFLIENGVVIPGGTMRLAGGAFIMNSNSSLVNTDCKLILSEPVVFSVQPNVTFNLQGENSLVDVRSINTNITLDNGESIHLLGAPGVSQGELYLHGGVFTINDGGTLFSQECNLHFGTDLDFRYNENAIVELSGDHAVLDIGGDLFIGNNATFKFIYNSGTGSGYVRMSAPAYWSNGHGSTNLWAGTHSRFDLRGINKQDKILEIAQETLYDPTRAGNLHGDLELFRIVSGTVEFAGGQALGYPDGACLALAGPSWLSNVHFKKRDSDSWRGVVVFGQDDVLITGNDFEGADAGLTAAFFSGHRTSVTNCDFYDCDLGINKYYGGIDISGSRFHHCMTAYQSTGGAFTDNITDNTIHDCGTGFELLLGTDVTHYDLTKNNLYNNLTAVHVEGGNVNARCNTISGNFYEAIAVSNHGNLNMNSARDAGYNDLSHNDVAYINYGDPASTLVLNGAGILDMVDGYNNLSPYSGNNGCSPASSWCSAGCREVFSGNYFYSGINNSTLYFPPCIPGSQLPVLYADNNQWMDGTQQPFDPALCFENVLNASTACPYGAGNHQPINVQDGSPVEMPPCGYYDQGGGHSGTAAHQNNPFVTCDNCDLVPVSSGSWMRIDSAVKAGIGLIEQGSSSCIQAVELLSTVLNHSATNLTDPHETMLMELAYIHLNEAYSKSIEDNQIQLIPPFNFIPAKAGLVINVMKSRISNSIIEGDYPKRLYTNLDLADAFRMLEMRDSSLSIYNHILSFADSTDLEMANKWICYVTAEKNYVKGTISLEEFLQQASQCLPYRNTNRFASGNPEINATSIAGNDNDPVSIHPNPATSLLEITYGISDPGKKNVMIFDCFGKMVDEYETGNSSLIIDVSNYSKGIYLVKAISAKTVLTEKFVVN